MAESLGDQEEPAPLFDHEVDVIGEYKQLLFKNWHLQQRTRGELLNRHMLFLVSLGWE